MRVTPKGDTFRNQEQTTKQNIGNKFVAPSIIILPDDSIKKI